MGTLKALILAAGEGTRLRPFTASRPKAMIPVGNKPVLEHIINALAANGISDIIVVVGYFENTIMSYFGDGRNFGVKLTYISQTRPIGTAHALSIAWDTVKNEDYLMVLAGDNYIDKDTVSSALGGTYPLAVITECRNSCRYGAVVVNNGKIKSLVEKPEINFSSLISTGIYIFDKELLNLFNNPLEVSARGISEIISQHLGNLNAVKTKGAWIDAVYPKDIIRLNGKALENSPRLINGTVEKGAVLKGSVSLGKGTRIRSGCYIIGPVVIGENCDIGPNVTIMPATSIGNDVQIGPHSYIADSVLMDNISIGTHCHLTRSAVDCGVEIASSVSADGISRSKNAAGVIIGQDCCVGSGAVFSADIVIGSECRIGNGAVVRMNLENRSIVV